MPRPKIYMSLSIYFASTSTWMYDFSTAIINTTSGSHGFFTTGEARFNAVVIQPANHRPLMFVETK